MTSEAWTKMAFMHLQQMPTQENGDGGPAAYTAPTVMLLKTLGTCPPKQPPQ